MHVINGLNSINSVVPQYQVEGLVSRVDTQDGEETCGLGKNASRRNSKIAKEGKVDKVDATGNNST